MFFSKPGNGICHQIHLERFPDPVRRSSVRTVTLRMRGPWE
jgi:aconitase A